MRLFSADHDAVMGKAMAFEATHGPTTEAEAVEQAKLFMAAMAKTVSDDYLRRMHRWTKMNVVKATGLRKAELGGERTAIEAEATRRGLKLGCGHDGDPGRVCSDCGW